MMSHRGINEYSHTNSLEGHAFFSSFQSVTLSIIALVNYYFYEKSKKVV